jgi:hypothetical protein
MDLMELAALVRRMRNKQRSYEARPDAAVRAERNDLQARVDQAVSRILNDTRTLPGFDHRAGGPCDASA